MKKNDRLQAYEILLKLLESKTPLIYLLQTTKDLSPLTKEICFGVCRHYYRLEAIANSLMDKRPKSFEVWLILLIGLYQLHFMKKPDYAVVKETVALLGQTKKSWAKGLVNAVLRTFCREQTTLLAKLENDSHFKYGHPDWFIKQLKKDWPQHWQTILKANDTHPPMSLRVNQQLSARTAYLKQLEEHGIEAVAQNYSSVGITLNKPCNVQDLPDFAQGKISVQDESAQLAVSLLALKPGLKLLDACCAPGGKTCHILEAEPQLATCIALDVDANRLKRVAENLARLNLQATLLQGDGLKPETWWNGQLFDRILLDAPCSATGVIRRNPDIKLLRTETEIIQIAKLQNSLLESLWPLLAPEGLLVYATCSVMNQENECQINRFLASHDDCQFMQAEQAWGYATGHGWQILPGTTSGDGFFYSVLKKQLRN